MEKNHVTAEWVNGNGMKNRILDGELQGLRDGVWFNFFPNEAGYLLKEISSGRFKTCSKYEGTTTVTEFTSTDDGVKSTYRISSTEDDFDVEVADTRPTGGWRKFPYNTAFKAFYYFALKNWKSQNEKIDKINLHVGDKFRGGTDLYYTVKCVYEGTDTVILEHNDYKFAYSIKEWKEQIENGDIAAV